MNNSDLNQRNLVDLEKIDINEQEIANLYVSLLDTTIKPMNVFSFLTPEVNLRSLLQSQSYKFQKTYKVLLKSTMLLFDNGVRSNMHTMTERLENKENDTYIHMVQLELLNTDFDKGKWKGLAENQLVSSF